MPAPALVVVFFVGVELGSPAAIELRHAAREALGPDAVVQLATLDTAAEARYRRSPSVAGVVRLSFEASSNTAHLICYLPRDKRQIERDLEFQQDDPEAERGRTAGFVMASILVEQNVVAPLPEQAPPPPKSGRGEHESPLAAPPGAPPTVALSAGMEGAGPGAGVGFGGFAGVEFALAARRLWLGGAMRARFGSIPEAQASSRFVAVGPVLTWLAIRPSTTARLGIRGSLLLSYLSVSHFSDDDIVPDEQSRFMPAAELTAHFGVDLAGTTAVFSDLGLIALAGNTELEVRHRVTSVWPWASGLARIGLSSQF